MNAVDTVHTVNADNAMLTVLLLLSILTDHHGPGQGARSRSAGLVQVGGGAQRGVPRGCVARDEEVFLYCTL